jgi:hypothetical protein
VEQSPFLACRTLISRDYGGGLLGLLFVIFSAACAPQDGTQSTLDSACMPANDGLGYKSARIIYGDPTWIPEKASDYELGEAQAAASRLEVALIDYKAAEGTASDNLSVSLLMCPDELMAGEVSLATCSGVQISDTWIVTALHCLDVLPCEELAVTSQFDTVLGPNEPWVWHARRCIRVVAIDPEFDTAIIEVENELSGEAFSAPAMREVLEPVPAILVSHPLGTSTKIDLDVEVRPSARGEGHYWARADAFNGSSGGGVFDMQGRLLGIAVSGLSDFTRDPVAQCMRLIRTDNDGVERVSSLHSLLRTECVDGQWIWRLREAN